MIYILGGISLGLGMWYVWLWGYEQGYIRARIDFVILMATFARDLNQNDQQKLADEWERFSKKLKQKR